MKTNGILKNSLALTFALSTLAVSAFSWADGERERGAILTERPAVRAIVEGPVMLRAYPRHTLGSMFLTDAAGSADKDCQAAAGKDAAIDLVANRRIEIEVPAGKVACVSVTRSGSQELLWKARRHQAVVASR